MVGINTANKAGVYSRHILQHNRITIPKPLVSEFKLKYTDKVIITPMKDGSMNIKPLGKTTTTTHSAITKKTHRNTKASKSIIAAMSNKKHNNKRKSLKQVLLKGSTS